MLHLSKATKQMFESKVIPGGLFKNTFRKMVNLGTLEEVTAFVPSEFEEYQPRTFDTPRVKLIGQTRLEEGSINELSEEFDWDYDLGGSSEAIYYDAEELSEYAGRLCYVSQRKELQRPTAPGSTRNQTYLDHIKETKHGSVTEHSVFNFLIWDVSRNMTHELVRHRVGTAFSQVSTRYVDQFAKKYFGTSGHTIGTYCPPEMFAYPELYNEFMVNLENNIKLYYRFFNKLVTEHKYEKKRARSVARHVLGGSSGTMLVFSVNARELNHIFDMRGSLFADDEIRKMTIAIFQEIDAGERALFNHWEVKQAADGRQYLGIRELTKAE